jgi:aryl-alcohol dehydrogenase-like predicted oxidoreductase
MATKVGMDVDRGGTQEGGLSAKHIAAECDRSLTRMQVGWPCHHCDERITSSLR